MNIVIIGATSGIGKDLFEKYASGDNRICIVGRRANLLTSSLRTPKIFIKEFGDFLMSCHQHCLGVNLLVQR